MGDFSVNAALGRFELEEPGGIVFADFRRQDARLFIDHVETPAAMRGRGAAAHLMAAIADFAAKEGLTLVPICSYAAAWMRRHTQV
jgi:predicted GNAT family acetyltransferase